MGVVLFDYIKIIIKDYLWQSKTRVQDFLIVSAIFAYTSLSTFFPLHTNDKNIYIQTIFSCTNMFCVSCLYTQ